MSIARTTKPDGDVIEKDSSGLARIWRALRNSLEGLGAAYRHEAAFRLEVWTAAVLIPVAVLLPVGALGRALLIGSILVVLICELVNSAIEVAIDRISLERHPLSKRAKDIGSAAVLMALINAGVVWVCVLFARFGPV
jgi:diacylglycerol kinase (ATP)